MIRWLLILLLFILLVSTTFGWELSLGPGLSVKNAFIYLIMIVLLIETAVFRNRQLELMSVVIPFGVFTGFCILSWFVASFVIQPDYYEPFATGISLKNKRVDHFIIFLLFFFGVSSSKDALSLIRIFLWMFVIGNLLTVVDGFDIPDLGIIQEKRGRIGGPMGEANQYGAFLVFTLPAVAALMWDSPYTSRVMAILGMIISVLAFLLASSRGAFVGLILGSIFAVYFLRSVISLRQFAIGSIVTTFSILILSIVFFRTELFADLSQRFVEKASGNVYTMTSGRADIWGSAIERMTETPSSFLVGFGWDAYLHMRGFNKAIHNVYFEIMFNLGLPALFLFLLTIYNLFATCRKAIQQVTGVVRVHLSAFVFGLASLCISVFFVDLWLAWLFIWAYVGLIMRLAVASIRENNSGTNQDESSLQTPTTDRPNIAEHSRPPV